MASVVAEVPGLAYVAETGFMQCDQFAVARVRRVVPTRQEVVEAFHVVGGERAPAEEVHAGPVAMRVDLVRTRSSMTSASSPLDRKLRTASPALATIASPDRLKEVFSSAGHPVRSSTASRRWWKRGLARLETTCARIDPSACTAPGIVW